MTGSRGSVTIPIDPRSKRTLALLRSGSGTANRCFRFIDQNTLFERHDRHGSMASHLDASTYPPIHLSIYGQINSRENTPRTVVISLYLFANHRTNPEYSRLQPPTKLRSGPEIIAYISVRNGLQGDVEIATDDRTLTVIYRTRSRTEPCIDADSRYTRDGGGR